MAIVYEIPLQGRPQRLTTTIAGKTYGLRTWWCDADEGGWCVDLSDANGAPLVCGIPLTPGPDLVEQYGYLGIGAQIYVYSDDPTAYPTFSGLGSSSHMVFVVG